MPNIFLYRFQSPNGSVFNEADLFFAQRNQKLFKMQLPAAGKFGGVERQDATIEEAHENLPECEVLCLQNAIIHYARLRPLK